MLDSVAHGSAIKLGSEGELYAAALRALMRRAHSIHEMRAYLDRRANDQDTVSRVIARLREQKYLDDARYAAEFARQRAQSRRQGRFRIARELRARGVPDPYIEAALDQAFAESDESALIRVRLKRQIARLRGPMDQKKTAAIYRSLLRAGFSGDLIRTELRAAVRSTGDSEHAEFADSSDATDAENA